MEVDVTLPMPPTMQLATQNLLICMHRPYKSNGAPCRKECRKCGYCGSNHKAEAQRPVQRLLRIMLRNENRWDWDNVIKYFARARPDYVCDRSNTLMTAAVMLEYIFPKYELSIKAITIGWIGRMSPASFIAERYFIAAMISRSPFLMRGLVSAQRLVRNFIAKQSMILLGPWTGPGSCMAPMNDKDPFTLESITDIPQNERFSYVCKHGKLYVLSLSELLRYVDANGGEAINPFTRELITEEASQRLNRLEARLPMLARNPIIVWRTPTDAFVDVLHGYERLGFYTQIEWFSNIHPFNVYYIYELMNLNPHIPTNIFLMNELDVAVEEDPMEGPRYALAMAMKKLIREPCDMQFYTICSLFLAIADHNAEMAQSLPAWVMSTRSGL
jgi:hypothetical protein